MATVDPHARWAVSDVRKRSQWRQSRLETLCVESNRRETEVVTQPEVSPRVGHILGQNALFDEYSMPYSINVKSLDIDTWLSYLAGRCPLSG